MMSIKLNPSTEPCATYETFHTSMALTVPPVFPETLMQTADRLDGQNGVDAVLLSLPSRISEAMHTMIENINAINSKVRTHTGTHV